MDQAGQEHRHRWARYGGQLEHQDFCLFLTYRIGIDLGGTKIEGILLDDTLDDTHDDFSDSHHDMADASLTVLKRKRVPTPKENYGDILDTISSLVDELSAGMAKFTVGICTPGAVSDISGIVKNSNTACLSGKPLKDDLEKALKRRVLVENDANCFVVAEACLGSAKEFHLVFGIIMGTGVGGGITIGRQIHRGRSQIAGEWGHHTLHPNGTACYCGRFGCAEAYLSGPALERRWFKLTGRRMPMPEIVQNLDSQVGKKFKAEWLEDFGLGLANVIDILDPDAIVLGGGLSNVDFLYTEGKHSTYEKVFSDSIDTPILKNQLGDSAGVYGAAML